MSELSAMQMRSIERELMLCPEVVECTVDDPLGDGRIWAVIVLEATAELLVAVWAEALRVSCNTQTRDPGRVFDLTVRLART